MEPKTERKQVKELRPGDKIWHDGQEWAFERDWPPGKKLQHFRTRAGQKRVGMSGDGWVDRVATTGTDLQPEQKPQRPWWRFWNR